MKNHLASLVAAFLAFLFLLGSSGTVYAQNREESEQERAARELRERLQSGREQRSRSDRGGGRTRPSGAPGQTSGGRTVRRLGAPGSMAPPPGPSSGGVGIVQGGSFRPSGTRPGQPQQTSVRPIFYLEPAWRMLTVGVPFEVQLLLNNPEMLSFDSMQVTLRYDPSVMELKVPNPEEVNIGRSMASETLFDTLRFLRQDPSLYREEVDSGKGTIRFQIHTPSERSYPYQGVIARFTMTPLTAARQTGIEIITGSPERGEPLTFLRRGGEDILNNPDDPFDGAVSAVYEARESGDFQEEDIITGDFRTRLRFEPAFMNVELGEVFDVDVVLDNPDRVPFNFITLSLRYDPRRLRAIDADQNNWIRSGINILDGHAGPRFPFTVREINRVHPETGIIQYRAGRPEQPLRSEGVIATIRFAAVGATDEKGTQLLIGFHPFDQSLNTGLYYRERDVLAFGEDDRDGVETFRLRIHTPRVTQVRR